MRLKIAVSSPTTITATDEPARHSAPELRWPAAGGLRPGRVHRHHTSAPPLQIAATRLRHPWASPRRSSASSPFAVPAAEHDAARERTRHPTRPSSLTRSTAATCLKRARLWPERPSLGLLKLGLIRGMVASGVRAVKGTRLPWLRYRVTRVGDVGLGPCGPAC